MTLKQGLHSVAVRVELPTGYLLGARMFGVAVWVRLWCGRAGLGFRAW